ncbi:hypothetical protein SCALM49S_06176 [Streptomyces californicus]
MRSRLALLVATAVAVAVVVAVACWFVTREQLEDQLDDSLRNAKMDNAALRDLLSSCLSGGQLPCPGVPRPVHRADRRGQRRLLHGPDTTPVPARPSDVAVAAGRRADALHTTENDAGKEMRVYTRKLPPVGQANDDLAVSVARPLGEIDAPLSTLAGRWPSSAASVSSARARPGCGWRGRGCGRWTS